MNGRDFFNKMKPVITFFEMIIKVTPRFILNLIWVIQDNSESKFALFYRYLYVKKYSKKCGRNIFIGKNVTIKHLESLTLGNNISIHTNCYIDAAGTIVIEDNISIANQTSIISFEHTWQDNNVPIKYNQVKFNEIIIKSDVWIGTGCRILAGVTINTRSIIAAGAVVNKNVTSNTIVGGVPAKVIKNI